MDCDLFDAAKKVMRASSIMEYDQIATMVKFSLQIASSSTESSLDNLSICFSTNNCTSRLFDCFVSELSARTYLQPHYRNGVFGNVYLSAGQN